MIALIRGGGMARLLAIVDRIVYGNREGKPGYEITLGLNILLIVMTVVLFGPGTRRITSIQTSSPFAFGAVVPASRCGI